MRRRTCHGLSRSFGERLFGTSSTKTRPRRWLDRPSASCRRHRVTTTTTASAPAGPPAACTGSLTSLFKVRTEAGDKKPAGSLGFSPRRRTISGRIGNHPERQERLKPSVRWDCPFRSEPGSALFVLLGFYADISWFCFVFSGLPVKPRYGFPACLPLIRLLTTQPLFV